MCLYLSYPTLALRWGKKRSERGIFSRNPHDPPAATNGARGDRPGGIRHAVQRGRLIAGPRRRERSRAVCWEKLSGLGLGPVVASELGQTSADQGTALAAGP